MPTNNVPMLDLQYQHRLVAAEVAEGFTRVLDASSYVLGPEAAAFERAYAEYLGVAHVLGVGNGTDALVLALRAAGIGEGDEVILPANTFVATAEAVALVGAKPVLVDSGEDFLIEADAVAVALTPLTRAVLPVHLYGQVADVQAIRGVVGSDVVVIEDAAQSQGAVRDGRAAGSLGDIAATSFYPGKNLGAYGDAGGVSTDSDRLADAVRALRNHGGVERYQHDVIGTNSRLDGLQAVVLSAKLRRLDEWNEQRRTIADRYRLLLGDVAAVALPIVGERSAHVYHQFVIQVDDRDRVFDEMAAAGIGVGIHYPKPIHLLGAFADRGLGAAGAFPRAERQAGRILSLPIYPGLTEQMQDRVVEELIRSVA
ncbi:DegT/DnrJ/EryC1/StrS family aminotransferase [Microbacterium yannicii]|uniref:DegT/DnrJ/EryC1/StrS family aminotransferase n=1 Tax=Microbacterium yannicii TaxID=671622 RepID=A0ABP9LUK8_9MICO|nr:DegT/DnrJ/EryC1/StrS family aminotransferase [Microbacterium yannicii]MCO5952324.1 DegT/DnrJ/EryC1/StrS family aminotransferase [Microbacterium yannicii]